MLKELWDKGLAVRKEVLGAEYVERTRYPTNYFLRDRDYVSYVYRRVTE